MRPPTGCSSRGLRATSGGAPPFAGFKMGKANGELPRGWAAATRKPSRPLCVRGTSLRQIPQNVAWLHRVSAPPSSRLPVNPSSGRGRWPIVLCGRNGARASARSDASLSLRPRSEALGAWKGPGTAAGGDEHPYGPQADPDRRLDSEQALCRACDRGLVMREGVSALAPPPVARNPWRGRQEVPWCGRCHLAPAVPLWERPTPRGRCVWGSGLAPEDIRDS